MKRGLSALLSVTPTQELMQVLREGREAILALKQLHVRHPDIVLNVTQKNEQQLDDMVQRNLTAESALGGEL